MDARTCEGPPDVNSYMHMLTSVSEDSWGKLRHVICTLMQGLAGTMGTFVSPLISCVMSAKHHTQHLSQMARDFRKSQVSGTGRVLRAEQGNRK